MFYLKSQKNTKKAKKKDEKKPLEVTRTKIYEKFMEDRVEREIEKVL